MGLAELMASQGASPPPSLQGAAEEPALGSDTPAPAKPAPAGKEEPDEELGLAEEGKVPVHVVGKMRAEKRALKEAKEKAEKEFAEFKAAHEARLKRFEARYGKFEKPDDQMDEDATVAEALWAMKDKPEVQAVLRLIQQHQGAKVSERTEKPAQPAAPAADPRVEQLVQERMRDVARGILTDAKVRDQLHGPILDYVLSQNPNPTREAILSTMKEYVTAQGWTNQFLRGDGQKPKPALVPNPGGLGGGAPKKDGEKPPSADAKPKSLSEFQRQNSQLLHERLAARGVER